MPETIIKVTATVKIPKVPNFLIMTDGQKFPIEAATDEALMALGEAWTNELVKLAKIRREASAAGIGFEKWIPNDISNQG